MKYILALFLVLPTWFSYAEEIYPPGCNALMVSDETVKLSTDKPTLVFLHNISNVDIWITHPTTTTEGMSGGWTSDLQAGNWSAFALDKKGFELSCIESRPGHEQQIPCVGVLAACQFKTVTQPEKLKGTFWAGENRTLTALTAHIGSRGFTISPPDNK